MTTKDINAKSPSAATLKPELIEYLFADCIADNHSKGHDLFLQDDLSRDLHLLVSGTVEISIYTASGRRLVANRVSGGRLIGEIGALDGGIRTATATCVTDCSVKTLSRASLLKKISGDGRLATALIELLCARIRWISAELGDQAHLKIDQRLAKRLELLTQLTDDSEGWIEITQADLAEFLGATRESVSKILAGWEARKIIEKRRGHIRASAPERLAALYHLSDE